MSRETRLLIVLLGLIATTTAFLHPMIGTRPPRQPGLEKLFYVVRYGSHEQRMQILPYGTDEVVLSYAERGARKSCILPASWHESVLRRLAAFGMGCNTACFTLNGEARLAVSPIADLRACDPKMLGCPPATDAQRAAVEFLMTAARAQFGPKAIGRERRMSRGDFKSLLARYYGGDPFRAVQDIVGPDSQKWRVEQEFLARYGPEE